MPHDTTELFPGSGIWPLLSPLPQNHTDPRGLVLNRPYRLEGRKGFVVREGFVLDCIRHLGLKRMAGISQLQFISGALVTDCMRDIAGRHTFLHTRLPHVLRAAVFHLYIAQSCKLDRDSVIVGVWSELMHDMFLCCGGDSWKASKQAELFDEDIAFAAKLLRGHLLGWNSLCEKYNFHPRETAYHVEAIVHGKGFGGAVHEVADTYSYIVGDLEAITQFVRRTGVSEFDAILAFASSCLWNIWTCVQREGDYLVVIDQEKLGNFIKLRALLWHGLYGSPSAKFLETFLRKVAYPYLLQVRAFRKSSLLKQGDRWLLRLIGKKMGFKPSAFERVDAVGSWPRMECFSSFQAAQVFEGQLAERGFLTVLASPDDFQKVGSKLGVYMVMDDAGEVAPFDGVGHPEKVDEIKALVASANVKNWYVYWVKSPRWSVALQTAWRLAREKWRL
ncbi:MAG: hypothetical protein KBC69_00370 [Candidatus Magasanikbacteria bacterium]|nr:hypothetical protein [Candidatus Magasanikbacteria bacterium]